MATVPAWAQGDEPGTVFQDCDVCPQMVIVPAGSYTIGSPADEPERHEFEGPRYNVTIAKPFAAGRFEVTFAEWDSCAEAGRCRGYRPDDEGWGRGDRPVIHVSWNDAQYYIAWLKEKTGQPYRLLSETEWEYVARARTTSPFSFGATISTDQANYKGTLGYNGSGQGEFRQRTLPVGSFTPNAFGLYDVHGNVWEWVMDCWSSAYYMGRSATAKPAAMEGCLYRALRGGSWNTRPSRVRSAHRFPRRDRTRRNDIGFRIARDLKR